MNTKEELKLKETKEMLSKYQQRSLIEEGMKIINS